MRKQAVWTLGFQNLGQQCQHRLGACSKCKFSTQVLLRQSFWGWTQQIASSHNHPPGNSEGPSRFQTAASVSWGPGAGARTGRWGDLPDIMGERGKYTSGPRTWLLWRRQRLQKEDHSNIGVAAEGYAPSHGYLHLSSSELFSQDAFSESCSLYRQTGRLRVMTEEAFRKSV